VRGLRQPIRRLNPEDAVAGVIKKINLDRVAAKRPKLKAEPALGRAAMKLCAALAKKDALKLEGDPFKGDRRRRGPPTRAPAHVRANASTPEEAAKSLLGEDAEKLYAFEEIGVGYAVAESGTPYWCAIFAKPAPPSACSDRESARSAFFRLKTLQPALSELVQVPCGPVWVSPRLAPRGQGRIGVLMSRKNRRKKRGHP